MKRIPFLGLLLFLSFGFIHLIAQDKKKKTTTKKEKEKEEEPVPVFNYTIDDPMDAFGPKGDSTPATNTKANRYFLYPEFYTYWPIDRNDTILRYECYDASHNPLNADTFTNAGDIGYISLIKSFTDYLNTYIDAEGKPRPQTVSKVLYRYERTGPDTWKALDVQHMVTTELQENRSRIVRTDTTTLMNPVTNLPQKTIRKYYKVEELTTYTNTSVPSNAVTDATQGQVTTSVTYSVPEFYFPIPKKVTDTTLSFRCYDQRDSLIPVVKDFDAVRYYSLFKEYIDKAHTYKDADGKEQPLPVSSIIRRYDKLTKDKWMSVEYPGNKYVELKAFKDNIVSSDTITLIDPVTGGAIQQVFNYYKVIKN